MRPDRLEHAGERANKAYNKKGKIALDRPGGFHISGRLILSEKDDSNSCV